jgi:nucleotide-binding universal stress UspA family protein
MKRLLIGYDGSACADAAIDDLPRAGLQKETEALVLSVADVWLPTDPAPPPSELPPALSEMGRKARQQALDALEASRRLAARGAERLRALLPNWRISSDAAADSPAWALIRKAEEWRANLVVLGSNGRSLLERVFLGSVSQKVAAEAPCSVRIARPRRPTPHEPQRLVVAVDGSRESMAAVACVAARNWRDAVFHVVAVLDARLETAMGWPALFGEQWILPHDDEPRQAAERMLGSAARTLGNAGLKVETFLLRGEPNHELLAHAQSWESDVIFLGARGLHHGGRLALGTTASAVATRAHCSVEIVRPG